ncbi:pleckstrin homology domain-containing family D member 1-like isoform X2 [Patiria miniata]|uniref:PH domain-containing protein n=1 Tax=Patiria miniata TaxID=46514 RepID=A0A914BA78_PATMI|nr:pleckstrin homology domain-containing family D member 1-like isoform X2 [Patiria miniata]
MKNMDIIDDLLLSKVQLWGTLWKKPFGPTSNSGKWQKRFFVIKEGYLLYYAENEKKDFDRKRYFNMHPKGVIPLGGALVTPTTDPIKMWAIRIDHDEVQGSIFIATDSENEREKWMEVMRKSSRVTWRNAELGETMIQTLEQQSLELARDSQRYREQWHLEAMALRDEMDKNEDLERLTAELEEEKRKIEETARELLDEHERTKMELEETTAAMQQVAKDQEHLTRASVDFQSDLEILALERAKTMAQLETREDTMQKLTSENQSLSSETSTLKNNLKLIEDKTNTLQHELHQINERLLDKEKEAAVLAEEKKSFSIQAQELESSLHDLTVQKEMTESELREEIIARRDAERRLKNAEDSLARLDKALKESRPEPVTKRDTELDVEIFTNVAHLKKFFEDIAMEAKLDANKPMIMKNALHARKSFVRKTKSFKFRKDRDKTVNRHSFASFRTSPMVPSLGNMARYSIAMGNLQYLEADESTEEDQPDLPPCHQLSGSKAVSHTPAADTTIPDFTGMMPTPSLSSSDNAGDDSSSVSSQGGSKSTEDSGDLDELQIAFEEKV